MKNEIVQLKSYDENTGQEIGNVLPITNSEAVKVENNQNLKEKLTEITNKIDQTNASLDNKANEIDLIVERKRIDNLTTLPEGSALGDAELIDGRIGVDGIKYHNIGTSIRTLGKNTEELNNVDNIIGIEKLSNELTKGFGEYIKYNLVLGTNAYNGACHIQDGKLVSYTSEFDNNTWSILNVKPGQQIEISLRSCNVDNYHIIFADKNNNVLSHYINDADKEYNNFKITIPKYAVKMGVNSYSYLPTIKIYTCISPLVNKKYIDTISKKIGEDVNLISKKIGDMPSFDNLIDITKNQCDGSIVGKVGSKLVIGMEDYYQHTFIECEYGDEFEITLLRSGSIVDDDGYVHFVDNKLNVVQVNIPWDTYEGLYTQKISVPIGATRMYICSYVNSNNFLSYTKCKKVKFLDIGKVIKNVYCKPNIEFISRQGQLNDFPENSLHGIKCAYENGYDNIRVSVIMTKDNIPVLCHDETINRLARNMDGSIIRETKYIKDLTLSQLNQYDWGRWSEKPELYGLNITTLEEFIKFAKYRGIKIRLEFKHDFTDDNISKMVELIVKWGMINKTTFCGGATDLDRVYARCKTCDFALIGHLNSALIPHVLKYKNEHNNVCLDIFTDDYDLVTPNLMLELKNNNIFINVGSAINVSEMVKWFEIGVDFIEVAYVSEPYDAIYNQYK